MGTCDVCSNSMDDKKGYLLTTEQVVTSRAYWQFLFWDSSLREMARNNRDAIVTQLTSEAKPWMVCEKCIKLFTVDENLTRQYAVRWCDSGGTFQPPGCGPVAVWKTSNAVRDASSPPPHRVEEEKRRMEEQERERKEREARERAENERRHSTQEARRSQGKCTMCGRQLGFLDRLFKREKHSGCWHFKD